MFYFCERVIMLPPCNLYKKSMIALSPFLYVIDLASYMEDSSLHVIKNCVFRFSILHDNNSPITKYTVNPESTRTEEDQRKNYVTRGTYWRQELTS